MVQLGTSGVVETFANITESKRDKEQIEQTAERFGTVVNKLQADMVNQAVASYIGQTAEVLMGALASMYFPAYKTNGLFNIYKDNYLTGTPYNFNFHYEDG